MNYLRQRHIDGMVIDGRQLERQLNRLPELLQETAHVGLDSVEALYLLVIVHKHVRVNFVDEDLVPDVILDAVCSPDHIKQLLASALIVCVVRIDDIDECTALLNVLLAVALQHVVTRKVINGELDIAVVVHFLLLNVSGGQQEEGLVRAHLLEYDLGD